MAYKSICVEITQEHFERSIKGSPREAIKELIWNACDADAQSIEVTFGYAGLPGAETVSDIYVKDDGHGIPVDCIEEYFGKYGLSRKSVAEKSPAGRIYHGKLGQGRYKAMAAGNFVDWLSVFKDEDGNLYSSEVHINAGSRMDIHYSETAGKTDAKHTGTIVHIHGIADDKIGAISKIADPMEFMPDLLTTILSCYDFSATPFAPSGKKNDEEALFGWIVSDFGLNDGIESGLVKTPRVVVRDDGTPDAESFRSKLYHIYADETVKDDINRAADPEEPLPDLLTQAYYLLGKDWQALYYAWKDAGADVPPVMITVANRTETAARIKYAFDHGRIPVPELCDPNLTIHIDSKTMDAATNVVAPTADEDSEAKISKADAAAILRETVDTVGQKGKRGEQIRNVISVGMLSEGWDAKTVTHILGLRAFSSQLLCEQVVGRGLRRTSYDLAEGSDMFTPEYVNIFGIPFNFLPHESDEQGTPPTTPPKTQVEALKERSEYEIRWPNIIRLDRVFKPQLTVDLDKIDTLELNAADTRLRADLAPIIDGKTDLTKCTEIDLQKLDAELRMQRIVFEASGQVYDLMKTSWQNEATKFALLGQVIRLVEEYLKSGAIVINPPLFNTDPVRQRIIYMMNMNKIVQHLWSFIKLEQTEKIAPIFDPNKKIRSTADMPTWFTSKPCCITKTSQISHCVFDSAWEATESYVIEKNPHVTAWAKNDHLGFEILYIFDGVVRKYLPDFLIRLDNGKTLILETKGQETRRDKEKRKALSEWVAAVNSLGEYGEWCNDVSYNIADVEGIIAKYI